MLTAIAFVVAAAAGAILRGALATSAWRVVAVNLVGSFLLGLMADVDTPELTIIGVGALGSFTTFSSFIDHVGRAFDADARSGERVRVESAATNPTPPDSSASTWLLILVGTVGAVGAAALGLAL